MTFQIEQSQLCFTGPIFRVEASVTCWSHFKFFLTTHDFAQKRIFAQVNYVLLSTFLRNSAREMFTVFCQAEFCVCACVQEGSIPEEENPMVSRYPLANAEC